MPKKLEHRSSPAERRETTSTHQFFLPDAGSALISIEEYFAQLLQPAYRYENPLNGMQKLTIEFQKKSLDISALLNERIVNPAHTSVVPPHWQIIADYLYQEGVLARPRIQFDTIFNDEPKYYSTRVSGASLEGRTDGGTDRTSGRYSRGVSLDPEEAYSKVFGEFLERYPLRIYRNKDLVHASINSLQKSGNHFLNPFHVAPTAEWQKKKNARLAFDGESIFRWVEGRSLTRGTEALIPAQMVFWSYRHGEQEPIIHYPITNGAGGMFTFEEALLSGLYELIQRDAFFIHWYNFISPPRIDLSKSEDPAVQKMYQDCKRYAIEPYVLDITSDFGIPTFLSVLIDRTGKGPAVALGGGCGLREGEGIVRALTESLGVRLWLRKQEKTYVLPKNYEPFVTYIGQAERLLLWNDSGVLSRIQFLLEGPIRAPKKDAQTSGNSTAELKNLVSILKARGPEYEIFYYEATHTVLQTLGYHSVAVAVPALLPLYFNEGGAPLGSPRIQAACRAIGHDPAPNINDFPHPFP